MTDFRTLGERLVFAGRNVLYWALRIYCVPCFTGMNDGRARAWWCRRCKDRRTMRDVIDAEQARG